MPTNPGVPQRLLRFPSEENKEWELVEGLYARLGLSSIEALPDEVSRVDPSTAICRANDKLKQTFQEGEKFAPVYRQANSELLCVPTGLIFIILNEGFELEVCIGQISNAEFSVEKKSPTGGAWLGHQSGSIGSALNCFPKLFEIKEIQSVEPQFLLQRALRGACDPN